jgi:hypothetical protein
MTNRLRLILLLALAPIGATAVPMSAAASPAVSLDTWRLPPSVEIPLADANPCEPSSANQFCVTGPSFRLKQLPDQPAEMVRDTQQALIDRTAYASRACRTNSPSPGCVGDLRSMTRWIALID